MLPLPAAPDVVYGDGLAVDTETLEAFELASMAAADLAMLLLAAYGTLETGITEMVETTVTGADGGPALLDTGDDAAAETGQMVV